jgi:hypothetical protein
MFKNLLDIFVVAFVMSLGGAMFLTIVGVFDVEITDVQKIAQVQLAWLSGVFFILYVLTGLGEWYFDVK